MKCTLCNENPEYYCCPRFDCDCSICIHCNNSLLNSNDYIYVIPHNQDTLIDDNSMQSDSDEEDNDSCDNSRDSDCLIDFFLNDNEIDNDNESIDLSPLNERFNADGLILSPNNFND